MKNRNWWPNFILAQLTTHLKDQLGFIFHFRGGDYVFCGLSSITPWPLSPDSNSDLLYSALRMKQFIAVDQIATDVAPQGRTLLGDCTMIMFCFPYCDTIFYWTLISPRPPVGIICHDALSSLLLLLRLRCGYYHKSIDSSTARIHHHIRLDILR